MKTFLFLLFAVVGIAVTPVFSQGFDCSDGYLPDPERSDCHPEPDANEQLCRARNCTWCPADCGDCGVPWCYHYKRPAAGGYVMIGQPIQTPTGYRVNLQREDVAKSWFNSKAARWDGEAETLTLDAEFQSDTRLRIKITDGAPGRWEVPLTINPPSGGNTNPLYDITFANSPRFGFKVTRKSSGAVLMDAGGATGNFIFAEQYLTLSWKPATDRVYGIGENEQPSFKHDFEQGRNWPLWAKDQVPDYDANLYGVQPYYTVLEEDGSAHSVALINSNAQEFSMLRGPLIRYITIGGILDFYFFLGPTPENTVEQWTQAVGRAEMPPYWALGFQLCRYGYNNINNMKAAVDRTAQYNIPHDVQYGDIDIMDRALDFTYSQANFPGLPDYVKELKTRGIKFMTILDPCISTGEPRGSYRAFDLGDTVFGGDVWMKRADGSNAVGKVWPQDDCYFPDYSHPRTREWWVTLITEFHDLLEYDGLWIDMNEPANFVVGDVRGCSSNKWTNPPYLPRIRGGNLATMTVCADNQQYAGRHYDVHSLYGWFQSEPTLAGTRAGTGKRALVLSRSTFLGSGHWAAHWLGDNFSRWSNLHFSVIGMLQYNQFGTPFVGSDICGFNENTNAEMCQRWMELGAFYTFSRNHNGYENIDQDPGNFGPAVAESSRQALLIRYTLLPYLYTLFYHHHTQGGTVIRALWHEFATDAATANVDRQFMWGSGFLVSPVLDQGATSVRAYLPVARWYDYRTGQEALITGQFVVFDAALDYIPLHVRGGNILPTQEPAINTELSRNNPLGLIVALNAAGTAQGSLYYDDGDSIDPVQNGAYFYGTFALAARTITNTVVLNGYPGMATKTFGTIRILGSGLVTSVTVNGAAHTDFSTLPSGEVVIRSLNLPATSTFVITF